MRKRFRFLASVAAVAALALAVPAQSHADDPDLTCDNGDEPVVFAHTHGLGLVYANVRLLCIE